MKQLPPPAHQLMQNIIPDLKKIINQISGRIQSNTAITHNDLSEYKQLNDFLMNYADMLVNKRNHHSDDAIYQADLLGHHLHTYINFEMQRRKIFWVDDSLAYMFLQTQLDIEGEYLKLPFPCCAFIFTDPKTLKLAEEVVQDENCDLPLKSLSVYLIEHLVDDNAVNLSVNMYFDSLYSQDWPYLLSRDLYINPDDHLEKILESHAPDVQPDTRDPVFTDDKTKQLLHLIFNAILYATSSSVDPVVIRSPASDLKKSLKNKGPKKQSKILRRMDGIAKNTAIDDVFYLPGKIDISHIKHFKEFDGGSDSRSISTRFMVRGHWRKACPTWKDKRLRWIEPYWKGPEDAVAIEKEYRMKM